MNAQEKVKSGLHLAVGHLKEQLAYVEAKIDDPNLDEVDVIRAVHANVLVGVVRFQEEAQSIASSLLTE